MRRRPSRLLQPLLVASLVAIWPFARGHVGRLVDIGAPSPIPDKIGLRVGTWNLRNFPRDHDLDRLRDTIEALDADVLAVQEVRDPGALQRLLSDRRVLVSDAGGRNGQRLGVVVDPRRVEVLEGPIELHGVALGERLRPAVSFRLRPRAATGPSPSALTVVVVHLKAMSSGQGVRTLQWLALWTALRDTPGPIVLLGDFNLAGSPLLPAPAELQALARLMEPLGLRPVDVGLCTAYWDGVRYDAWQEPTRLDAILLRGAEALHSGLAGACSRHRCRPVRSSPAHPDPDVALSDHCPVWIDLGMDPS